jgi:hypothetical protein
MNRVVAIRASFDPKFPDLNSLPKGQDRLPGRELGDLVVRGLRKHGFQVSDLECEEPLFVTRCRSGDGEYKILCYVYTPDPVDPVWVVECPPTIGFLGKLMGKSDDRQIGPIVEAIHDTLRIDSHIRETRWFADLPFEPFSVARYDTSPNTKT